MATKKQKRLAAQAKRKAFMEAYRKDGLAALERAHQEEKRKGQAIKERTDFRKAFEE